MLGVNEGTVNYYHSQHNLLRSLKYRFERLLGQDAWKPFDYFGRSTHIVNGSTQSIISQLDSTRRWESFVEPWIMLSTVLPNKGTHCTQNVLSLMVNCRVSVSTKNVDDAPAFIDLNGFVMSACSSLKWWDRLYRRAILLIRKVLFIGSLVFYQMCNVCTYICFSYVATAAHGHLVVHKLSLSRGHYSTK